MSYIVHSSLMFLWMYVLTCTVEDSSLIPKPGDEASTCTLESVGKCTDVMLSSMMENEKGAELNVQYRMYLW